MWYPKILALCVLGAVAQQISVETPPFDLVDETLSVNYGDVSLSPPGRVLPLNGNLHPISTRFTSNGLSRRQMLFTSWMHMSRERRNDLRINVKGSSACGTPSHRSPDWVREWRPISTHHGMQTSQPTCSDVRYMFTYVHYRYIG